MSRDLKWTPERLAAYRSRLERWAVERTQDAHRFTTAEIQKAFAVSLPIAQKLVEGLIADGKVSPLVGDVIRKGSALGYAAVGVNRPAVTLQDLLDLARKSVRSDGAASRGRRVGDAPDYLTPTQLKDAKSAANLVAEFVPGAKGQLARVDEGRFTWDATKERWDLEEQVGTWSDDKHKTKWLEQAAAGEVWTDDLNSARGKYVAAIRNLLDLGAHPTHGLLRCTRTNASLAKHPALEWKQPMKAWFRLLTTFDPSACQANLKRGLRILALYATRRRQYSVETTDWLAVRDAIEEMYEAGENGVRGYNRARAERGAARQVWRLALTFLRSRLLNDGAPRFALGSEYNWESARDRRISLIPDGAIISAAGYASSDLGARGRYDYQKEWVDGSDQYLRSLIEGGVTGAGLRDWILWSTASEDRLVRLGLPPRALVDASPHERRRLRKARKSGKIAFFLKEVTLVNRLREIGRLCGFLQHHYEPPSALVGEGTVQASYNFANQDDLSALISLPVILAYSEWRREESDETENETNGLDAVVLPSIVNLALNIAKIADPYLRARAEAQARAFEKAGDPDQAMAAREMARKYMIQAQALVEWALEHKDNGNVNKNIQAVAEAWMGGNGREGWLKLGDLVHLLLAEAEKEAGLTIAAQVAAVREASNPSLTERERRALLSWQTHSWAGFIRSAMFVNFARKIPIRARAMSKFRLSWWEANDRDGRAEPWSPVASVKVHVPAEAMKSSRKYDVSFVRPENVGDPAIEHGTYRDLNELWLRPRGAREMVLTRISYDSNRNEVSREVVDSEYFFPPFAYHNQQSRAGGGRWAPAALSSHFAALVHQYAVPLGIDLSRLESLHGALRFHVIRLLYGTYWAPRALVDAKLMLHHVHADTTERLYCGKSAEQVVLEAQVGDRQTGGRPGKGSPSEVELLRRKLAEMEMLAAADKHRADAAEARAAAAEMRVERLGAGERRHAPAA